MNRRAFLGTAAAGSLAGGPAAVARETTLAEHRIASLELRKARIRWPRHVGRNAVKGHHGNGPTANVVVLKTNEGATGWGHAHLPAKSAGPMRERIIGKPVASLVDPARGILDDALRPVDVPLHDLAGVILGQPVWKMMSGRDQPFLTSLYSGMIYFDDLDPEEKPAGIEAVLENCRWDHDYGYRQFKVKIGRGHKWMPGEAGLQRDIEVVKAIHDAFPDAGILVDGNNGFTVETFLRFLEGIAPVPLFWVEEPFHETAADWRKLAAWMVANGYEKTLRADGEARPDVPVLEELEKDRTLQTRLTDILGLGFTPWRRLMPRLKAGGISASPHTWGSGLKSIYTAHFAGAVGNHPTVEGVTFVEDDVDRGENMIIDGQLVPSSRPGFGLVLKG